MSDKPETLKRNKKGEAIPQVKSDHMKWVRSHGKKDKNVVEETKPLVNETHLIICQDLYEEEMIIERLMHKGMTKWEAKIEFNRLKEVAEEKIEAERVRNLLQMAAKTASEHPLASALALCAAKYADFDISSLTHERRKINRFPKNRY